MNEHLSSGMSSQRSGFMGMMRNRAFASVATSILGTAVLASAAVGVRNSGPEKVQGQTSINLVDCEQPPSASIPPEQQSDACFSQVAPPEPPPEGDWVLNRGWVTRSFYLKRGPSVKWAEVVVAADNAGEFDTAEGNAAHAGALVCGGATLAKKETLEKMSPALAGCAAYLEVGHGLTSQQKGAAKRILAKGGCLQLKLAGREDTTLPMAVQITVSDNEKYCLG